MHVYIYFRKFIVIGNLEKLFENIYELANNYVVSISYNLIVYHKVYLKLC